MTWYTGHSHYDTALAIAFGIVVVTAISARFIQTPYGRFADDQFGIALNPRLGWFLMELPAPVIFVYFYFQGPNADAPFPLFVLFVWIVHYANRGFVMPALMRVPRGQKGSFSFSIVAIGWIVTSLHGYLNGSWASTYSLHVGWSWFTDPRFLIGVSLYYAALMANVHSDHIVRILRTREEVANGVKNYRIPRGGLFEYVSNPSYFTELLVWVGFALFTWSLAGVYILAISATNLVPRAMSTHRWYQEKFPDYPAQRKILIPYLW